MKHRDIVFDAVSNTLTITKAFADKLSDPNSEEFRTFAKIKAENPSVSVHKRTHKTSSGYVNQYKKLTYKRMEQFMSAIAGGSGYREIYDLLRVSADAVCLSPYAAVRAWFEKQFPEYWKNPLFYVDNKPEIIDFADILDKAEKKAA